MAAVSGVVQGGGQPWSFEAKVQSRFQEVKDWVMANPKTLAKVGFVFTCVMAVWPVACALLPIGLGVALGVGIPLAIAALATLPTGIALMDMRMTQNR